MFIVSVAQRLWPRHCKLVAAPHKLVAIEVDETKSYLNHPLYYADGKVLVDEIWRYAEMWERLADLAARLGQPTPTRPPRAKSAYRKDRRSAAEVLTAEQKRRIQEDARIEFELMGFEP